MKTLLDSPDPFNWEDAVREYRTRHKVTMTTVTATLRSLLDSLPKVLRNR